jgi:hypothetical protein
MDQNQIVKQMLEFHKTAFRNSFNAMVMLQDQTEKVMQNFFSQAAWIPEDLKKSSTEWISSYKKGRDDFKKAVDDNFRRVDDFFNPQDKASGKK